MVAKGGGFWAPYRQRVRGTTPLCRVLSEEGAAKLAMEESELHAKVPDVAPRPRTLGLSESVRRAARRSQPLPCALSCLVNLLSVGVAASLLPGAVRATEDVYVRWGTTVMGVNSGDGWLKVGDKFLPMNIRGSCVVRRA